MLADSRQPDMLANRFPIPRWERYIAIFLMAVFCLSALGFSLGPILEAPDEPGHYRFTRTLILTRQLPDTVAHRNIQDHQPPLYYMLMIPASLALDGTGDFPALPRQNPFWGHELGSVSNDNKNLRLHTAAEEFPYTASHAALVFHVVRLHSILIGLATVILSYLCFQIIWPRSPSVRLLALGMTALWPQFVWLSGVLNNDNLLIMLSTASLYMTLRQLRDGPSWRRAAIHGLVLSAALLTKASGVFLCIPVGIGVLADRRSWRFAALTLVMVLALTGWWYARNVQLTHSLAGWPHLDDPGYIHPGGYAFDVAFQRLPFAYQGFWARFGNVSVAVGDYIYRFFDLLALVSIAGIALWLWRLREPAFRADSPQPFHIAVIGGFALAGFLGLLINAATLYTGNQGRYALPGLTGWAALIALGVWAWMPHRFQGRITLSLIAALMALLLVCLFGYYFPAFRPLAVPAQIAKPLAFRFGDVADLTGTAPADPQAQPGQTITIDLYWKALGPSQSNLIAYLHTVDSEAIRRDSYPATGNLLSIDWRPGQTWAERYVITIPADTPPGRYPLLVGLYDAQTQDGLPAVDGAGNPTTAIIGDIVIRR